MAEGAGWALLIGGLLLFWVPVLGFLLLGWPFTTLSIASLVVGLVLIIVGWAARKPRRFA